MDRQRKEKTAGSGVQNVKGQCLVSSEAPNVQHVALRGRPWI